MIPKYSKKNFSNDTQKAQAKNQNFWKMCHMCANTSYFVDLRMSIRCIVKFNIVTPWRSASAKLLLLSQSLAGFAHFLHIFLPTQIGRWPRKPATLSKINHSSGLGPVIVLYE